MVGAAAKSVLWGGKEGESLSFPAGGIETGNLKGGRGGRQSARFPFPLCQA